MMLGVEVAKLLKAERIRRGKTQQDVATGMGVGVSYVQRIEYAKEDRQISTYERYAAALGVKIVASLEELGSNEVHEGSAGLG
jgi:transcriptional regulator with XRE-family HTH domain